MVSYPCLNISTEGKQSVLRLKKKKNHFNMYVIQIIILCSYTVLYVNYISIKLEEKIHIKIFQGEDMCYY